MQRTKAPTPHPSGDKRFKMLDAAMRRHNFRATALIEILHTAQELFGYLEDDLLIYVSRSLQVPPSKVYGVATFYHFFSLKPQGRHTCVVCMGTACYVKGAATILADLEKQNQVKAGETTSDNELSLLTARCLGACGLAPAVVFDGAVAGKLTSEGTLARVQAWKDGNDAS